MAVVEQTNQNLTQSEGKEQEIQYRVFPEIQRYVNYEDKTIRVEIALPGVKKEDIKLKALPTWFHIEGKRGHMLYSGNKPFGAEVVPEKTTAKYESGLLTVFAKIKDPLEDATQIKL
jgi:HSP20 family molecular chaperone IbpA